MQATYNLNSNELNIDFLNSIQELFKNKNIDIVISDTSKKDTRSEILQKRLEEYKKNPNISIPITSDFWRDNEKQLIHNNQKQAI